MQRAPAFLFADAREARDFGEWLDEHFDDIRDAAETTTRSGKLQRHRAVLGEPDPLHAASTTRPGDAAGQNLTGKATQAACDWITENYDGRSSTSSSSRTSRPTRRARRSTCCARAASGWSPRRRSRDELIEEHDARRRASMLFARAAGVEPRRLHVGREQQRRALGQRHHGDVHRHRPGRGERRRVLAPRSSTPSCCRTATTTTRSRSRR